MLGELFLKIDDTTLSRLPVGLQDFGKELFAKGIGSYEQATGADVQSAVVSGHSLKPIAPCHLSAKLIQDDGVALQWIRRSRAGFAWPDGADAPLQEAFERYAVTLTCNGQSVPLTLNIGELIISSEQQHYYFGRLVDRLSLSVSQLSDFIGAGHAAVREFQLR
jgi:hypothetical protein